jgi:hypothetical protein
VDNYSLLGKVKCIDCNNDYLVVSGTLKSVFAIHRRESKKSKIIKNQQYNCNIIGIEVHKKLNLLVIVLENGCFYLFNLDSASLLRAFNVLEGSSLVQIDFLLNDQINALNNSFICADLQGGLYLIK